MSFISKAKIEIAVVLSLLLATETGSKWSSAFQFDNMKAENVSDFDQYFERDEAAWNDPPWLE